MLALVSNFCVSCLYVQAYNLVGAVRHHGDESTSMIEVDFHNTATHHSFSLANYSGYSMAALNERALVLASERSDEQPR